MPRILSISGAVLFGIGVGAAPAYADTGVIDGDNFDALPPPDSRYAQNDLDILNEMNDGVIGDNEASVPDNIEYAQYAAENEALETIDDTELQNQRGGFALGGMNITIGADIKTFLNNELALHTVVTWSDKIVSETHVLSGQLTMVDANSLRDQVLSTGNITMKVGNDPVFLANQGQTAISHRTDGTFQNVLLNTANNVTARQEVNATLDIAGYSGFAQDMLNSKLSNVFGYSINDAIVSFGF
jgi:hypothetical protein